MFQSILLFDEAVVAFFQQASSPALDALMACASMLADKGVIWIALVLGLIIYKPTRFWGVFAAVALLLCWFCDELLLKSIVQRDRPFIANPDVVLAVSPPHGFSFPSSHSASSLVVATFLMFCPKLAKCVKGGILAFAILVAFSRMYLCVHYFTDVVVGSLVGVLFGVVFGIIATKVAEKRALAAAGEDGLLDQDARLR